MEYLVTPTSKRVPDRPGDGRTGLPTGQAGSYRRAEEETMIEGTDQKDYRASIIQLTSPGGGWVGERRMGELLDGYARQVRREEAERLARPSGRSDTDPKMVLVESLVQRGYTPYSAQAFVRGFIDLIRDHVIENSDHDAYRELADHVIAVIGEVSDPGDWDGDESELEILHLFLGWLPDMIRHQAAEALRRSPELLNGEPWSDHAADLADPFGRNSAGQWIRKSDGSPVPWAVVSE